MGGERGGRGGSGESRRQSRVEARVRCGKNPGNCDVPISRDGYAERIEAFERGGDVENGLHPRGDDQDRRARERGQIGRLVVGDAARRGALPRDRPWP